MENDAEKKLIDMSKKGTMTRQDLEIVQKIYDAYIKRCENPRFNIFYVRGQQGIGHAIACSDVKQNRRHIGFAFGSPADNYCKLFGKTLALVRMVKYQIHETITNLNITIATTRFADIPYRPERKPRQDALEAIRTENITHATYYNKRVPHWFSNGIIIKKAQEKRKKNV